MNIDEFVQNVADLYDDPGDAGFTPKTSFKDLPEWSSLMALSVLAMIDEEYGVRMKGNDIRNSETIQDLFDLVEKRKGE